MTTVLDKQITSPALHAFVIGVGSYRHVTGGPEPLALSGWDLRQVMEPPLSARAVLDWLTSDYAHPAAVPLGSLEVLISLPNGQGQYRGQVVDEATLPRVEAAVQSWFRRCDSNPANVALFYFCGHGLCRNNQYLLLEDFGESWLDPMAKSIDLHRFRDGMARCEADTQIFIADTCRQLPWKLKNMPGDVGSSLVPEIFGGNTDRNTPMLLAARQDESAYGPSGGVTYYTQALLAALRGAGAEDPGLNDQWEVRYRRLASAVEQLLLDPDSPFRPADREKRQEPRTDGESRDVVLARLHHPPKVPVRIDCHALASASVTLQLSSQLRNITRSKPPGVDPWRIQPVPAHHAYELAATYPNGTPPGWIRIVPILPPSPRFPAQVAP